MKVQMAQVYQIFCGEFYDTNGTSMAISTSEENTMVIVRM